MEKFERRGRCKYCGFISSYEPICSYEAKKIITNSHKYDVYILCHNCEREFASTIANGLEIKSTWV